MDRRSAIDSAKAIALGTKYQGDVWDLYLKKASAGDAIPLGVILTIAATGSEMSDSTVITNEEGWLKRGLHSDLIRPHFAIMNPELTYTLPEYQTMSGCTDILMHTMERYFSHEMDTDLVDGMAESLLKSVMRAAKVLLKNSKDYNARAAAGKTIVRQAARPEDLCSGIVILRIFQQNLSRTHDRL